MTFIGIDDQTVELKITNYQFPQTTTPGDYDSNWLNIYINVKSKLGHWHTIDPSLLTWEVEKLITWLLDLSVNKIVESNSLEFIEPNLSFHLLKNDTELKSVRIKFDLESRPKSANDNIMYFVDGLFSNEVLRKLSDDLTKDLSEFPKR
jgi:hypothetical protein